MSAVDGRNLASATSEDHPILMSDRCVSLRGRIDGRGMVVLGVGVSVNAQQHSLFEGFEMYEA